MVSRRKILSRSRDDLNLDQTFSPQEEEEDVWYQKDKLYKEHIQEVLDKWTQIDDEIWAKVIVFERNRRVAKAYARAPVLTINGSDDGFDGMRIGLCGFDNPMRDQKTEEFKKHIGQGVKIKMDDAGNILIRRYAKSNVYIKSTASSQNEETSIGADILKLPNQALESEKIVKLFDMKKFQSNVNRELRRAYPDRRRLETQCLSAVAFVKSESDILECPIWVLIVNVVAMDMLKSKLPPVQRPLVDIKNRPRIPIPDEDPYSVAGNGSGGSSGSSGFGASGMGNSSLMSGHSAQMQLQHQQQQQHQLQQQQSIISNNSNGSSVGGGGGGGGGVPNSNHLLNNGSVLGGGMNGHTAATREQLLMQTQQLAHKRSEKPPKLPPRDNIYGTHEIPKPDYDDIEVDTRIKLSRGKSDKGKDNKKYDDPYYCGLRARVPNFVKTSSKSSKDHHAVHSNGVAAQNGMNTLTNQKKTSIMMPMHPAMHAPAPPHMHPHHIQQQQMMAVAAAHAVAHQQQQQQQQQHQHPMHHHAHAHAQQMWQTRSFESGIGIYNHNTAAMTTTTSAAAGVGAATPAPMGVAAASAAAAAAAALTATATTFLSSTETQQQLHAPQPPTSAQKTTGAGGNAATTTTTIAEMYYPNAAAAAATAATTSTLYNYLAPTPSFSNEHHNHNHQHHHNQHHHLHHHSTELHGHMSINNSTANGSGTASSTATSSSAIPSPSVTSAMASSATASTPMSHNASYVAQMLPHGLSPYVSVSPASPGGLLLTSANGALLSADPTENIYGQTRNLNFPKQVHQQQQQQHYSNKTTAAANGNGHAYHQHTAYNHSHRQRSFQHQLQYPSQGHHHHRAQYHHHRPSSQTRGSRMCSRHAQVSTPARSTPGEFYYKAHELYFDGDEDYDMERQRRHQSRPTRRSSTQLDNNCNCVSCYALAPLFGAPTPKRPVRSLSQQQLRQHHLLSGAAKGRSSQLSQSRGLVKWCSDSDVSLMGGREDTLASDETDEYRDNGYLKPKPPENYEYSRAFDLDNDFDMEDLHHSQMDYKKQLETPKKVQKFNEFAARHNYRHQSPNKDSYPLTDGYVDKARLRQIRSPTPQRKKSIVINEMKTGQQSSNLLHMRSKSQSIESFFEEPNEEGSLYMYGGRKRIAKAPSTTNIYDRVKSNHDDKEALKNAKKYNSQLNLSSIDSGHDTIKPLVPPPMWRGAKRMNLKGLLSSKGPNATAKQFDMNNNVVTKSETILSNFKIKNQDFAKNNNKTPLSKDNKTLKDLKANYEENGQKSKENHHQQRSADRKPHSQSQPSLAAPHAGRASRSSSRVDVSDMESIYGYLKPRKQRSLSMKKVQIQDY